MAGFCLSEAQARRPYTVANGARGSASPRPRLPRSEKARSTSRHPTGSLINGSHLSSLTASTSSPVPMRRGPWDPSMQHGSPPAALVVWARGEDSDAGCDAGRARDRRPDAPGSGGAVDHRERGPARGPQDPALRRQAARRRRRRGQCDGAEDQGAGQRTCRQRPRSRRSSFRGRTNRASSRRISPPARS